WCSRYARTTWPAEPKTRPTPLADDIRAASYEPRAGLDVTRPWVPVKAWGAEGHMLAEYALS
ncbi:hypothetical protein, partial [Bifidobacterium psychraerophilum]|uniref:hypothetical protein n=1 Tax=Bifidobacterium psychraerophilum TaxID=218140 RepID=UPI001955365C